ncbi:MAG: DUF4258 domain-containing protein [Algoriphagus sp.]|uniref:DUF4258 domain-containing protein n=1 Tax=Algoriphagus sp. TaxID=1872435 RepID=UPI001EC8550E|nr:DUF4258 domain-containing protein [Algoriphagus sp.]MBA4301700.1 hypothetical protein [Cyclobacterium sp.]MDP2042643.1 DUF4258 domain-containing protein [Algoriphagus sp.]MDP3471424.1 DUF4258 domain-containing protein [Algoriphagus sp.]
MDFDFSTHAVEQMSIRGIPYSQIIQVLNNPHQLIWESEISDIEIYQSKFENLKAEDYLIRVFVNRIKNPKLVVTVYKTSKVLKYWKNESDL